MRAHRLSISAPVPVFSTVKTCVRSACMDTKRCVGAGGLPLTQPAFPAAPEQPRPQY